MNHGDVLCSLVHSCVLCDNCVSPVVVKDNNQEPRNKRPFCCYNGVNAQWSWAKKRSSSLLLSACFVCITPLSPNNSSAFVLLGPFRERHHGGL